MAGEAEDREAPARSVASSGKCPGEESGVSCWDVVLETPGGLRKLRCGEDEYLWWAAAREGIALPSICLQGRCLECAGRLFHGKVDQSAADSYFPEDEAAGFVLLCRARPRSSVRIRTHQAAEMREHRLAHGLPAPYA
jgi:ferredoxin